jgi:hypothetical protein
MSRTTRRLLPEQLRWCCAEVPYDDVEPAAAPFLGQDRAIRALQLGMEIRAPGYHIFVSGLTGTGRGRTVQHLIEKLQVQCRPIPDRCFVHDPEDPWRPLLLRFDAGQGQLFKEDVAQFGRNLLASLPRTLSSAALNARRKASVTSSRRARRKRRRSCLPPVRATATRWSPTRRTANPTSFPSSAKTPSPRSSSSISCARASSTPSRRSSSRPPAPNSSNVSAKPGCACRLSRSSAHGARPSSIARRPSCCSPACSRLCAHAGRERMLASGSPNCRAR